MTTTLTKDERFELKRLAARARGGLYHSEKQALAWIAEVQTMEDGECRKALKSGADFGYGLRALQRGIHGTSRKGKLEYPGLLARKIVSVSGYVKGGRAPDGAGLTPAYVINRDVLLTYVPEVDFEDDMPKGDTLGDTFCDTSPKKGDTLGDPGQTSIFSTSLTHNIALPNREPRFGEAGAAGDVVVGEDIFPASASPDDASSPLTPHHGGKDSDAVPALKSNGNCGGQEKAPMNPEVLSDATISSARLKQLERKMTDAEIGREYRKVFDDLNENKRFGDWRTTADHRRDAAALYRKLGGAVALEKFEVFLETGNHEVPTRDGPVVRTWLLNDFVIATDPETEVQPKRTSVRLQHAVDWFSKLMADGEPHDVKVVVDAANDADIHEDLLDRAKERLPIRVFKRERNWYWQLDNNEARERADGEEVIQVG